MLRNMVGMCWTPGYVRSYGGSNCNRHGALLDERCRRPATVASKPEELCCQCWAWLATCVPGRDTEDKNGTSHRRVAPPPTRAQI